MKSWTIAGQTGTDDLRLIETDKPRISGTEVLVRMTTPGVVPFDHAIINNENEANFPAAVLPIQPGNQGAGVVEDPGGSSFKKGERVMFGAFVYGFMRPGSWAEYVAVEADHLGRVPDSVPDGAASQAAVAYPTAYFALKEAGMAPGKTVLATGIGGSVGNAAYQLAKALGAKKVFSTAGSSAKADAAAQAGFDNVIDLSKESMMSGIHARNGGEGVDIVIDSVGGQVIAEAIKCVRRYGKTITLGFAAGRTSTITLADLILHRGSIQGYGAYTSTPAEWREAWDVFNTFADEGKIKVLFDRSFPFEQAPQALRYMATQRPFGAVALHF
ncbi:zinc-binding alcohol dehydrogenase family protein [Trinickia violacea]|uniref:Zinc-binding alcohol dehydrogenase family protein n=1 Tax=Trinickia violacea TaxID=2571746 RepID=A0A4P8ITH9_9BURK|nr:zinc-binding alcohol dehydrogenase family protein [Trinickia violacea]QCP50364.1 zinc-binding alcohol dehydrogenase family protein [Trinickia violacea]